jgi:hypothetical protein
MLVTISNLPKQETVCYRPCQEPRAEAPYGDALLGLIVPPRMPSEDDNEETPLASKS